MQLKIEIFLEIVRSWFIGYLLSVLNGMYILQDQRVSDNKLYPIWNNVELDTYSRILNKKFQQV